MELSRNLCTNTVHGRQTEQVGLTKFLIKWDFTMIWKYVINGICLGKLQNRIQRPVSRICAYLFGSGQEWKSRKWGKKKYILTVER